MLVTSTLAMIVSFKHRGLKRFYVSGTSSGINPNHAERIQLILADLNAATSIEQLRQPVYRLHPLKGQLAGFYSIHVYANWRIIFRLKEGKVSEVDLLDYH